MAVPPNLVPDTVAAQLAAGVVNGVTAVTFRGWLSTGADGAPLGGGIYRLFTSPWVDEWLEIKSGDLLFQQPGTATETSSGTGDGSSTVWVKREAQITKCHAAEACYFAEQEAELGADPTAANPTAAKYPRYGR